MFKVGDRVRCLVDYSNQFTKGKIYIVTETTSFSVSVLYDDKGRANGYGKHCFELVNPFKVGDKVHHITNIVTIYTVSETDSDGFHIEWLNTQGERHSQKYKWFQTKYFVLATKDVSMEDLRSETTKLVDSAYEKGCKDTRIKLKSILQEALKELHDA